MKTFRDYMLGHFILQVNSLTLLSKFPVEKEQTTLAEIYSTLSKNEEESRMRRRVHNQPQVDTNIHLNHHISVRASGN